VPTKAEPNPPAGTPPDATHNLPTPTDAKGKLVRQDVTLTDMHLIKQEATANPGTFFAMDGWIIFEAQTPQDNSDIRGMGNMTEKGCVAIKKASPRLYERFNSKYVTND
jgi:hypothetical protein